MLKKILSSKGFAIGLLVAGLTWGMPSHSAIIFQDNFDSDNSSSVLNFNNLLNWTVSDGTIDYIRNGDYSIHCFGNAGGCLDMDGSTNDAGRITSKTEFNFLANVQYTLTVQVSGNQRQYPPDSVRLGLTDGSYGQTGAIQWDMPFTLDYLIFMRDQDWSARLFIEGLGNDSVGVIVDNVVLSDNQQVPEPASLALFGVGLAGLGFMRRRRA